MGSISVIVPFFNSEQTLQNCIESVLAGTVVPAELILVDDASTDASPAIAEALVQAHPDTVKVIRLEQNSGPSVARNRGAGIATGEFFFFIDSDTEVLPDTLENFLARIPETDAITGIYDLEPLNNGLVARYKAYFNYQVFMASGVVPYETFSSHSAGIRAEVFRELGGYNENIRWGMDFENEEFGRRIIERHRLLLDPAIAVRHVFPGFARLTKTYFIRVSSWVDFFTQNRQLESGGTATARNGLGTIAAPATLFFLLVASVWPPAAFAALGVALLYLYAFAGFFAFVARHRPLFLPAALILNLYFSTVITVGAFYGLVRALTGRGHAVDVGQGP